jgi:hypothetical protein
MPRRYPPELRERAVRIMLDTIDADGSRFGDHTESPPARCR